jgi:TonB family protein
VARSRNRSPWTILGVASGSDRDTIRRAYARKLRVTNPEDDPDGFMALREAYEAALLRAGRPQPVASADEDASAGEDDCDEDDRGDAYCDDDDRSDSDPVPQVAQPQNDSDASRQRAADRAEADAFRAACRALVEALTSPWPASEADLRGRLAALLASPQMFDLGVRDETEHWLAATITDHLPRADALIEPAVAAFGWDQDASFRSQHPAVHGVQHRLAEWRFVHAAQAPDGALHKGWRALGRPPRAAWQMRLAALRPGLSAEVATVFEALDYDMPGLRDWLDPAAEAWWRAYLAQPRLSLGLLLLPLPAGLLWLGLVIAVSPDAPSLPAIVLVVALTLATPWAVLRLVLAPQRAFAENPWDWPDWKRLGWIGGMAALPLLALLPATPPSLVLLIAVAIITLGWATITNPLPATMKLGVRIGGIVQTLWFFGIIGTNLLPLMTALDGIGWSALALATGLLWWRAGDVLAGLAMRLLPRMAAAGAIALAVVLMATAVVFTPGMAASARVHLVAVAAVAAALLLLVANRAIAPGRAKLWLIIGWVAILGALVGAIGDGGRNRRSGDGVPILAPLQSGDTGGARAPFLRIDGVPGKALPGGRAAAPLTPIDGWSTIFDYPPALLTPGEHVASLRLEIRSDGRIMGCRPTIGSGSAAFDRATCAGIGQRGQFRPARDAAGLAQASHYIAVVRWAVPRDYRPPAILARRADAPEGTPDSAATRPKPRQSPEKWLVFDEFPDGLFGKSRRYDVDFALDIGTDGRASGCTVTKTTGSARIDTAFCAIMARHADFEPARDPAGKPVPLRFAASMWWTTGAAAPLPAPLSPPPPPPAACPPDTRATDQPGIAAPPRRCGTVAVVSGDYPEAAARAGATGTTRYELAIGSDGAVTDCRIVASSGSDRLDARTCELMRSRARFQPALGADGVPVAGKAVSGMVWKINDK